MTSNDSPSHHVRSGGKDHGATAGVRAGLDGIVNGRSVVSDSVADCTVVLHAKEDLPKLRLHGANGLGAGGARRCVVYGAGINGDSSPGELAQRDGSVDEASAVDGIVVRAVGDKSGFCHCV